MAQRTEEREALEYVEVVPYDSGWWRAFEAERALLLEVLAPPLTALEHIGSTAVPGLQAKPIIDMMAAVGALQDAHARAGLLTRLGYHLIKTGMPERLFFRKRAGAGRVFHLHVVEESTWPERNERLMRDYLRAHPQVAAAYGALKESLAAELERDSLAYTRAKTAFIQGVVDRARDALGLPRVDVWGR